MKCSKCNNEAIVTNESGTESLCSKHFDDEVGCYCIKRDKVCCINCKHEITDDYIFFDKHQNMFCSFKCILAYNKLRFLEKQD